MQEIQYKATLEEQNFNYEFVQYVIEDPDIMFFKNDFRSPEFAFIQIQANICGSEWFENSAFFEIESLVVKESQCASDAEIEAFFAQNVLVITSHKNYIDFETFQDKD